MSNSQSPRRRPGSTYTTKSGNSLKVNRSFSDRIRARKDARARQRAVYLSTLPKNRWKRLAYRLQPKRVFHYWFSRQGAIMALKIAGIGIVVCFLLLMGLFAYLRKDLPNITNVSGNSLPGSVSYYDSTGKTLLWQDYNGVKRVPVPSNQIAGYMKEATVAIEDKDFYHEGAFNIRGISRAAFHDLVSSGGGLQGGSTITQQLVKLNEDWTGDRTLTRKVKEVILAVELSREYTKDQILTGYLNIAPYGGVEYGCESAAEDYFHVSCENLSLAQAAMLAAIPQSPSTYSPYGDPQFNPAATPGDFEESALISRQHYVLDQMAQQGMITQAEANTAKQVNILAEVHPLQTLYQGIQAPYFVMAAKNELYNKYCSTTASCGGWKVTTTLNMGLQKLAEKLVTQNLPLVEADAGDEEALAAEDVQTGQMVALVGGVDFSNQNHGQINYAQINISPGSSIKPFDYVTLINDSKNVGAGSVLYDSKGALPGYAGTCPYNPYTTNLSCPDGTQPYLYDYDGDFPGAEPIRYALAGSRNVPAVKAMLTVGTNKVINTADALMGDSDAYKCYNTAVVTDADNPSQATKANEAPCYGSSGIGDGAYLHLDAEVNGDASLSRLGAYIPQTYIKQIQDASGKTIYQWSQPKPKQVVDHDSAYIIDNMLSDPRASYLPNRGGVCTTTTCPPYEGGTNYKFQRYNGWDIAVKTGTTNYGYEGLMTAWSTKYAVASWVGYHTRNKTLNDGNPMEALTEPLTRGWMEGALDTVHTPPVNWQQPSDIKVEPAYQLSRHISRFDGENIPSPAKDIYPSWYTPPSGSGNTSQVIDKVSGDLATSCTPADAKEYVYASNASTFSVDKWVPGGSSYNTTATDDVHNCSDTKPSATLTVTSNDGNNNNGQVVCDQQSGCTVTVTITQGTHPLASSKFPGSVVLDINGKAVKTFSITSNASPQTFSYSYTPSATGDVSITASVTDSVLYQATSNGESVSNTTNSNGNNGNNNGNGGGDNTQPQALRRGTIPMSPTG